MHCRGEALKALEKAAFSCPLFYVMTRQACFAGVTPAPAHVSKGWFATDSAERPLSDDANVRRARSQHQLNDIDRGSGILHDSLSDGLYNYRRRSSVADPDFYLGNSLSEGHYEMPPSLRVTSNNYKPRQVRYLA